MSASPNNLHRLKMPVGVFMVLLLLAVQAMVASPVLHEAFCDHDHSEASSDAPAQSDDGNRPDHDCVVKTFSQGMVDCGGMDAVVAPVAPAPFDVFPRSARLVAADLTLLPSGRAPPVLLA